MMIKPRKKIIFFAFNSISVLKLYWEHMKVEHNCFWLVYNSAVYEELNQLGYPNIIFYDINSYFFQQSIYSCW